MTICGFETEVSPISLWAGARSMVVRTDALGGQNSAPVLRRDALTGSDAAGLKCGSHSLQ
jgi:hypothetical protein